MDENGNGHNKQIKFQKLWSGWNRRNLFGFKISLPNFEISLQKSQSSHKKKYHLSKTFVYSPKSWQHELRFLLPASRLSALVLPALPPALSNPAVPELMLCPVQLLVRRRDRRLRGTDLSFVTC